MQAFLRKTHASESFGALRQGEILRENLNHLRSAPLVHNLGFPPQEVRKGLTSLAVAHRSVGTEWRVHKAFDGSAPALQWMRHDFAPFQLRRMGSTNTAHPGGCLRAYATAREIGY
jgi:hypothetical protein